MSDAIDAPAPQTDRLAQVFDNYAELCRWCDAFFARVYRAQRRHVRCKAGCATCCTLTTVTALEAQVLREYLSAHPEVCERIAACPPGTRAGAPAIDSEMCPLLLQRECAVYAARPVICRTHGLPVRHRGVGVMPSCTMNFMERDVETLDDTQVLDADRITENLMRLNLVFCRLSGREQLAERRIALADLLSQATVKQ